MTTALVPAKAYAILNAGANVGATIAENLGGEAITPNDLTRVTMPTGGGKTWSIPSIDGEESVKELEGVIIYSKQVRAYWPGPMTGNEPPSCQSPDTVHGIGDPGGECAKCPHAQFGSKLDANGEPGKGQACKLNRLLFLVRKDDALPLVVSVPPSSLVSVRKYLLGLGSNGLANHHVVTRLSLAQDKSTNGITYSKIVPSKAADLEPEARAQFDKYRASFKEIFDSVDAGSTVSTDAT